MPEIGVGRQKLEWGANKFSRTSSEINQNPKSAPASNQKKKQIESRGGGRSRNHRRRTGGEGDVPLAELLRGEAPPPPEDLAILTI